MTYANAQVKNIGNDEGDILSFFNNTMRNMIQKNGGDNSFSIVEELCHDKDEQIPLGTKTKIRLTHSGHTITQFEKSFIRIRLKLTLKMQNTINTGSISGQRGSHLNMIFVGFKNAAEFISELQFWVDGKLVDNYNQGDHIREAFAYNSIKARDEKCNSPHSHSLWESVVSMSPNVAGVYLPLELFENNREVPCVMELVIPFTDHLALQAWRLYPNRIIGEMEEEVNFSVAGLVWCQLPPKKVGEVKKFWDCDPRKEYNAPDVPITNHFTQINQPAVIVSSVETMTQDEYNTDIDTKVTAATANYKRIHSISPDTELSPEQAKEVFDIATEGIYYTHGSSFESKIDTKQCVEVYHLANNTLQVIPNGCVVERCRSNCAGFGIKPDVVEGLMMSLADPIIIPAQELTRHQFESKITPGSSDINISKSVPLKNATNITMMFPAHTGDYTCFQNIMCSKVRLTVNKKAYPETEFDNTWDGRFLSYQLMANELDGCIEPTQEVVESFSRPLNHVYEDNMFVDFTSLVKKSRGARFLNCPFDNTSFGINFQLERGNSGYVFDGIDSGSSAVSIEFRATKEFDNEDDCNPLSYPNIKAAPNQWLSVDTSNTGNCTPEMWICSDTYWTWDAQSGVTYYSRGRPTGYD